MPRSTSSRPRHSSTLSSDTGSESFGSQSKSSSSKSCDSSMTTSTGPSTASSPSTRSSLSSDSTSRLSGTRSSSSATSSHHTDSVPSSGSNSCTSRHRHSRSSNSQHRTHGDHLANLPLRSQVEDDTDKISARHGHSRGRHMVKERERQRNDTHKTPFDKIRDALDRDAAGADHVANQAMIKYKRYPKNSEISDEDSSDDHTVNSAHQASALAASSRTSKMLGRSRKPPTPPITPERKRNSSPRSATNNISISIDGCGPPHHHGERTPSRSPSTRPSTTRRRMAPTYEDGEEEHVSVDAPVSRRESRAFSRHRTIVEAPPERERDLVILDPPSPDFAITEWRRSSRAPSRHRRSTSKSLDLGFLNIERRARSSSRPAQNCFVRNHSSGDREVGVTLFRSKSTATKDKSWALGFLRRTSSRPRSHADEEHDTTEILYEDTVYRGRPKSLSITRPPTRSRSSYLDDVDDLDLAEIGPPTASGHQRISSLPARRLDPLYGEAEVVPIAPARPAHRRFSSLPSRHGVRSQLDAPGQPSHLRGRSTSFTRLRPGLSPYVVDVVPIAPGF